MALHYQTITQVAALLEARQISPVELTEEMLQRIAQLDGRLKSYATLLPEQARAAARSAVPSRATNSGGQLSLEVN